jgi:hypothetical protein
MPAEKTLLQQHRLCVDTHTEEIIGRLPLIRALVEPNLSIELVSGEIEIAVTGHGERVRSHDARIPRYRNIAAIEEPTTDAAVLIVADIANRTSLR